LQVLASIKEAEEHDSVTN